MSLNKRIYRNMLLLAVISLVAASLLFFYQLKAQLPQRLKEELSQTRITIIDNTGKVTYDNQSDTDSMENHAQREEIAAAFTNGSGSSQRYSQTIGQQTYYFATKINETQVARLAITTSGVNAIIFAMLPGLLLIFVFVCFVSIFVSSRLVKNIVQPLNEINLDGDVREVYDELSPFIRKIEQQKKEMYSQLKGLEKSAITIKAITENMNEGLLLFEQKGGILSANKAVLAIFNGFEQGDVELQGKNVLQLTRNEQVASCVAKVLNGKATSDTMVSANKIYNIFGSPVKGSGGVLMFLDITEKSKSEQRRRQFSANVSHELKTPLTTISGYAEMLQNGMAQQKDVAVFAGKISLEARRLQTLIQDIIKLSQLDEIVSPLETESVSLKELVAEIFSRQEPDAAQKQVILKYDGDENLRIKANRQMLDELLTNLIENSIKYNKVGGKVEVIGRINNGSTVFSVLDTGIGIDKKHLERIFERFYRVDKSRNKKTGGTGLGLSIVKHIAEHHGFELRINSELNKGTRVDVLTGK